MLTSDVSAGTGWSDAHRKRRARHKPSKGWIGENYEKTAAYTRDGAYLVFTWVRPTRAQACRARPDRVAPRANPGQRLLGRATGIVSDNDMDGEKSRYRAEPGPMRA